jgi:hypothetical protein
MLAPLSPSAVPFSVPVHGSLLRRDCAISISMPLSGFARLTRCWNVFGVMFSTIGSVARLPGSATRARMTTELTCGNSCPLRHPLVSWCAWRFVWTSSMQIWFLRVACPDQSSSPRRKSRDFWLSSGKSRCLAQKCLGIPELSQRGHRGPPELFSWRSRGPRAGTSTVSGDRFHASEASARGVWGRSPRGRGFWGRSCMQLFCLRMISSGWMSYPMRCRFG